MKTIQNFQTWNNGQQVTIGVLNAYLNSDNLSTQAIFYWFIYAIDASGVITTQIQQGTLTLTGADYLAWEGTNTQAWDWISKQLNLTITGDYIPPAQ